MVSYCTVWYMRRVTVTIDVPESRQDVYDFLDIQANHELFTDHMMRDWRCDGPERGVGSKVAWQKIPQRAILLADHPSGHATRPLGGDATPGRGTPRTRCTSLLNVLYGPMSSRQVRGPSICGQVPAARTAQEESAWAS